MANVENLFLKLKSGVGSIGLFITLIVPGIATSNETCIDTYQVDCANLKTLSTKTKNDRSITKSERNMQSLFYSGGILSNQLSLTPSTPTPVNYSSTVISPKNVSVENLKSDNDLNQVAVDNSNFIDLRENFYNQSDKNRRTVQKCLRKYGYNGKIDGIWGDNTYFALLSYQEPDMSSSVNGFFDGIKDIVASLRKCDEILDNTLE